MHFLPESTMTTPLMPIHGKCNKNLKTNTANNRANEQKEKIL
jgi:hypothetical protein